MKRSLNAKKKAGCGNKWRNHQNNMVENWKNKGMGNWNLMRVELSLESSCKTQFPRMGI